MVPHSTKLKTRFYNEIKVADGRLTKFSSEDRIKTEYAWFSLARKSIPHNIPRIYNVAEDGSRYSMTMEYVESDNLFHQYREKNAHIPPELIFSRVATICDQLHGAKQSTDSHDMRQMYLEKPLASLDYFYSERPLFKLELIINGTICRPVTELFKVIYAKLESRLKNTSYGFIHGDLTLSNMLADAKGRLYFLDPRGKFGRTEMFGDVRYDVAKLYFSSIANFDSLNYHNFTLTRYPSNRSFDYVIEEAMPYANKKYLFQQAFKDDEEAVEFINCSIWLSLFPHLKEGEDQTLVAYLHGTLMLEFLGRRLGV